jgi:cation diffusion facilitator CzcD-associated flavoprotein CzcO
MTTRNQTLDMLIIGAGQAGLALGSHLKQKEERKR